MIDLTDAALRERAAGIAGAHLFGDERRARCRDDIFKEFVALRAAARAEQREADAKIADDMAQGLRSFSQNLGVAQSIAEMIRSPR